MPDQESGAPDYRPGLIICAWDPDETAWDPVEDLSGQPWNPQGARSYLLYRVLSDLPDGPETPAIGLLRVPANQPDAAVQRAVKTAAQAIARHMPPLPRSRAN